MSEENGSLENAFGLWAGRKPREPEEEWTLDRIGRMLEEVLEKLERIEATMDRTIATADRIIAHLDRMNERHAARLAEMRQREGFDDPFVMFREWSSDADERAYDGL